MMRDAVETIFDVGLHVSPLSFPEEGLYLFSAELNMMRTGGDALESHSAIRLNLAAKGKSFHVGDHVVTIKKLHAPLAKPDVGDGAEECILSEYPIPIEHVQLKIKRVGEAEA